MEDRSLRARGYSSADGAELDAVDEAVVGDDVGDDDEFVALFHVAGFLEFVDREADGFVGVGGEGEEEAFDGAEDAELAEDFDAWGEGENRRARRTQGGEAAGHEAEAGEGEDVRVGNLVGHDDGGAQDLHLFLGKDGGLVVVVGDLVFDAAGDFVEDADAFDGVFADGGFAGEHDAVGLFEDGVGDVGDFGASRHGRADHRFEHVGRDDDGFAVGEAGVDGGALDDG